MSEGGGRGRLIAWTTFIVVFSALNYAARLAGGKPPRDAVFRYATAVAGLVELAIVLGIVLAISSGAPQRALLALRRPTSWRLAAAIGLAVVIGVFLLSAALEPVLHPGREQGLAPTFWDGRRAGAFAANFVVLAAVAPVVEELTFRGVGFGLLERFGRTAAVVLVGLAFGLAHGLLGGLPLLVVFGSGLAYLRSRTESVYPGMIVHGAFNAVALVAGVAT